MDLKEGGRGQGIGIGANLVGDGFLSPKVVEGFAQNLARVGGDVVPLALDLGQGLGNFFREVFGLKSGVPSDVNNHGVAGVDRTLPFRDRYIKIQNNSKTLLIKTLLI